MMGSELSAVFVRVTQLFWFLLCVNCDRAGVCEFMAEQFMRACWCLKALAIAD